MKFVFQSLKAIYAGVAAGLGALGALLVGPTASIHSFTDAQWVTVAGAIVVAFGAVYGVTNAEPTKS
jgi:hypothetical protein